MSKTNLKNKKYILIYFQTKITLQNNFYHILNQTLSVVFILAHAPNSLKTTH